MFRQPEETVVETVRELAEKMRVLEGRKAPPPADRISTGCPPLDRILPEGGLRRGTLVEWLSVGQGSGAATLALLAAREACRSGGVLVVIDRDRSFYPPGAVSWGMELRQMVIVRPTGEADNSWAWDQSLRSPAVAAVWGWPRTDQELTLRRWQLAAESSGAIGLLLRGGAARGDPSWAELRLFVQPVVRPQPVGESSRRYLRVELLRARSALIGKSVECALDEETRRVDGVTHRADHETNATSRLPLAAQLAHSTPRRRERRA